MFAGGAQVPGGVVSRVGLSGMLLSLAKLSDGDGERCQVRGQHGDRAGDAPRARSGQGQEPGRGPELIPFLRVIRCPAVR